MVDIEVKRLEVIVAIGKPEFAQPIVTIVGVVVVIQSLLVVGGMVVPYFGCISFWPVLLSNQHKLD